jgi:hypothetical protein
MLMVGGISAVEHVAGALRRVTSHRVVYASSLVFVAAERGRHAGLVRLVLDDEGITVRSWFGPAFRVPFADAILESGGTFSVKYRVSNKSFLLLMLPDGTAAIESASARFRDRERSLLR